MIRKTVLRAAGVAALALSMSACALLKSPPAVQTYRFGGPADEASTLTAAPVQVALRRVEFPQAVEGDRILGVTGTETAYIKGARWVAPAQDLYLESLESAFLGQSRRVRLIGPREIGQAARTLDVDIRAFEARYDTPESAPMVVVTAYASLLAMPDRSMRSEKIFTVRRQATENRVSAIVDAYDAAVRDLNTQIVDWTDSSV